jgi:signal peptidase II
MIGRGLKIAALALIIDQLGKYAVLQHFGESGCSVPRHEPITAFFDLVLTCNRGMSFGLFNTGPGLSVPIFSIAAAAIVVVLTFWLSRVRSDLLATGIGLIIGGAIGNMVDRLRLGGVVDFLYLHAGSWYWPAFNFADSAICLGVVAMLFEGLLSGRVGAQANGERDVRR